jgi:hypothetical protein
VDAEAEEEAAEGVLEAGVEVVTDEEAAAVAVTA